jgi:hypothetical protein
MALFEKRVHLKPYEYPDLLKFRGRHPPFLLAAYGVLAVRRCAGLVRAHRAARAQRAQKHDACHLPD